MADTNNAAVQHRIPAEGADPLSLSGVNDANLLELGKRAGLRVVLRDDHLLLSGDLKDVERAVPVAQHMVEMARNGVPFGTDDVARFYDAAGSENGVRTVADAAPVVVPGPRKTVRPKSEGQAKYLTAIEENDVVIGIGPAGTGKTYLAVAMAVDALFRKRVKRIILARPAVEAGENLGFLPGDLQEKIDPYLRPLYDALEDMIPPDRLRRAMESRAIEIAPLAYMRGRTLQDAFVILDEAQNATRAQMKMFLTRLGLNSKAVITGDKTQVDLPRREDSGLVEIENVLKGIEGIAFSYLSGADVIRHRLVKDIIRAYDAARGDESGDPQREG
ncbi:PhoH family protein [Longimicrobium sp.]|uniref:PhoH family protein n=1 Tax=Longimicrobium sp. TaxID=2029185 RepID=UPI002E36292F|nr:PhoH family protein [Longimicrobium sp.]HEX6036639.1 PhoH family protein [Longimicrobium sp.]